MLKIDVLNLEGKKVCDVELEPKIFDVEPKAALIQQAVIAQLANARQSVAHTQTRGEVRGGGKKPWKQKGTGRARQGSIRSPLWKGGGVIFGPRPNRNYSLKINKKSKRKALFMALTEKLKQKKIVVVDDLKLEKTKTKEFIKVIKNLPINSTFLIILPNTDLSLIRATNNLKITHCLRADSLNVYDVMRYNSLLLPKKSLEVIKQTFLK